MNAPGCLKFFDDGQYEDVLDEYITIDAARNEYGVVIDAETLTVDSAATKSLRQSGHPLGIGDKAPMPTAAE